MKDIIIIGAGGIGREVAYIIEEINEKQNKYNILGFIDDNKAMWGKNLNGYIVLGGLDYLKGLKENPHLVIAMANCNLKKTIVSNLKDEFKFETIIHPSINLSPYMEIGEGSIIYKGTILTVNTKVGNHVIISGNCGIGHDTIIGSYSSILWGSNLSGYDTLGEEVFIGVGASIVQSIKIKDKTKIEAGKTVIKDI